MQPGNFIDVFLARHVSGTYGHHQVHYILSCSIWFSAPSFWMGGGLESRCVGRAYGADHALRRTAPSAPYIDNSCSILCYFILYCFVLFCSSQKFKKDQRLTLFTRISQCCLQSFISLETI